jgi:transposase, IS30 family
MPGLRLCLSEREEIRAGLERNESLSAIGRRLGRPVSTVSREVCRNGGRSGYRAAAAQRRAEVLARRPKMFRLVADPVLAGRVYDVLTSSRYSPETCARILRSEGWVVSHETIYRACYDPVRGLPADAWRCLPRRRQRRKHAGRKWGFASGNPLGEPVSVSRRHPVATARIEPGHLEGDLLVGANNRSAVLTLCERVTRYTFLARLPYGYGTGPVAEALYELLEKIPPGMRRTLTWDQGREMKYWADVQAATGTLIYFCDPHSPWQKGTVENNNGILRRWLPKSTDLAKPTQTDLDQISQLINNMPRRIHQWHTATDTYHHHLAMTG